MTRDQLIMTWMQAQSELERAKAAELQARIAIVDMLFPQIAAFGGAQKLDLGKGYAIIGEKGMNYTFDRDDAKVHSVLNNIRATHPNGAKTCQDVVAWKPRLREAKFNLAPVEARKAIETVIIIKPATPSLTLIKPKA